MIKYERGLNHSYLIFEIDEEVADELSINMLRENQIRGLLPIKISKRNGKTETAYEISRFQNMIKAFEKNRIQYDQILTVLKTLNALIEELEAYYLQGDGVMLNPEYIYWNNELTEVSFCFNPERGSENADISLLSELILKRADFGDYKSVVFAYELNQAIGEENFSLQGVIESFEEFEHDCRYRMSEEKPSVVAEPELNKTTEEFEFLETEKEYENGIDEVIKEENNIIQDMASCFNEEDNWENDITTGRLFGRSKKKKTKKQRKRESEDEFTDLFSEESFFSAGEKEDVTEKMLFDVKSFTMNSLNNVTDSFKIETFPYLIGSVKYAVDGCIDSDTISRFHARFDQSRGKLYLSDLNSENGTYLNGERLRGDVQREIKSGDKIRFGNLDFVVK